MEENQEDQGYQKIVKIQKLSKLVGCSKKCLPTNIEILLFVVNMVIIILCLMNILIFEWNKYYKGMYRLKLVIFIFLLFSVVCLFYNMILRRKKRLHSGYVYFVAFYGSLLNIGLTALNFLFIFIACIAGGKKVKGMENKNYVYKSLLVLDIFSMLLLIAKFFLWYSEFLLIYAKTYDTLKEHIEAKMKYYQSQNQKVVNIELNDEMRRNNPNDIDKVKSQKIDNDIPKDIKSDADTEKEMRDISSKKEDDLSSIDNP